MEALTTTPLKQKEEPTKRKLVDEATVGIKKKKKNEDKLMVQVFGRYALENITWNDNVKPNFNGFTFHYLKKNFLMKLNASMEVSCFLAKNDSIALFNVRNEDVNMLNELLTLLMSKRNLSKTQVVPQFVDIGETLFLRMDAQSLFFDKNGKKMNKLPKFSFQANVSIKIMGLQLRKQEKEVCKLLIHIDQIRVLDDEATRNDGNECIFLTN